MFRWGPDQFLLQPNFSASRIKAPAKFQRQRTRFSAVLLQVISIAISLKWAVTEARLSTGCANLSFCLRAVPRCARAVPRCKDHSLNIIH
jgi:hypothetical protein